MRGKLCKGLDFLALQFENKDKEKQYNFNHQESPVRARVPGLTTFTDCFPSISLIIKKLASSQILK